MELGTSPGDGVPVLDLHQLELLKEDLGHADTIDIVKVFLEDAIETERSLQEAAGSGDFPTARRAAHTLKGAARTLGAEALAVAAEKYEWALKTGDAAAEETDLRATVVDELMNATGALLEWLAGEGGSP